MNTIKKSWVLGVLMLSFLIVLNGCGGGGGSSGTTTTTTAPSAPSGVTATAGDGQVAISWNSVSGATSYIQLMVLMTEIVTRHI